MENEKQIRRNVQLINNTEYTVNVDLKLPNGYKGVGPSHKNRLHITFINDEGKTDKQGEIIRENPDFPVGVPVRSNGENADIHVIYNFLYTKETDPGTEHYMSFRYILPVKIEEGASGGTSSIMLSEVLDME
ncbi:MAG: hypothetical protein LAT67_14665 [Balneolales bacterium]|nr:hypothetical protein [Balneolales bacterium]